MGIAAAARTIEIDFGGISVPENWPFLDSIDTSIRIIYDQSKDFRGWLPEKERKFFSLPLPSGFLYRTGTFSWPNSYDPPSLTMAQ